MTDSAESRTAGRRADPARLAAGRILDAVLERGAFANLAAVRLLERKSLQPIDRRFASAIVYGTLSRIVSIDWLLAAKSKTPLAALDPWVRTLLRMGVWQLRWARSVPAASAVDESVRLARLLAGPGGSAYVNAVLRQMAESPAILPANNPAVLYSLPPDLYGVLRKAYGDAEAAAMAESFLQQDAWTAIRVNSLRTGASMLATQLAASGLVCEPGRYCPEALRLDLDGHALRSLPGWQAGLLSVQDEAAMLVGHAADPQPGQMIIDLCAAPGGKTCHLAERSGDRNQILAFDSHPGRLRLIEENKRRLGLSSITCKVGDATGTGMDPSLAASADLVLADVPCSGLGLLGRKPEIRLNMNYARMTGLYPLQAAILTYAASLVKAGGALVYSTCTVNPAENIIQAEAFLKQAAGRFCFDPLDGRLPASLLRHPDIAGSAKAGWIQLLPHRHSLDGFFIARMRRVD